MPELTPAEREQIKARWRAMAAQFQADAHERRERRTPLRFQPPVRRAVWTPQELDGQPS
jgi:hypothetical protein